MDRQGSNHEPVRQLRSGGIKAGAKAQSQALHLLCSLTASRTALGQRHFLVHFGNHDHVALVSKPVLTPLDGSDRIAVRASRPSKELQKSVAGQAHDRGGAFGANIHPVRKGNHSFHQGTAFGCCSVGSGLLQAQGAQEQVFF